MAQKQRKQVNYALITSEAVFLILCLWAIWNQSYSAPVDVGDPDPDGYTSYSARLQEHFEVDRDYRRYPGYPVFIIFANFIFPMIDSIPPGDIHEPVHILQTMVCLVFALGFYLFVRHAWGIMIAWLSLAILASPNFLVLFTSYPFADFLYGIGWACCFGYLFYWVRDRQNVPSWSALVVFIFSILVLQLVKPNAATMLAFFSLGLVPTFLLVPSKFRDSFEFTKGILIKSGIMLVIAIAVAILVPFFFGDGPIRFVVWAAKTRIVYYLPPASQSSVEMKIEAGKADWQLKHGQKIEDVNFTPGQSEIRFNWVDQVWLQRLEAHPLQYIGVTLNELLRKHYLIIDQYVPFFANTDNALYVNILPRSQSAESRLYRSTGLMVDPLGEGKVAFARVSRAVIRLVLFWALLLIGWWKLFSESQVYVVGMTICAILYIILHAATVFIDGRYMLAFAVPLYVTQAVGLATLTRFIAISDIAKKSLAGTGF